MRGVVGGKRRRRACSQSASAASTFKNQPHCCCWFNNNYNTSRDSKTQTNTQTHAQINFPFKEMNLPQGLVKFPSGASFSVPAVKSIPHFFCVQQFKAQPSVMSQRAVKPVLKLGNNHSGFVGFPKKQHTRAPTRPFTAFAFNV